MIGKGTPGEGRILAGGHSVRRTRQCTGATAVDNGVGTPASPHPSSSSPTTHHSDINSHPCSSTTTATHFSSHHLNQKPWGRSASSSPTASTSTPSRAGSVLTGARTRRMTLAEVRCNLRELYLASVATIGRSRVETQMIAVLTQSGNRPIRRDNRRPAHAKAV